MLSNKEAPFTAVVFLDTTNTMAVIAMKSIMDVFSLMPITSGNMVVVKNKERAKINVVTVSLRAMSQLASSQIKTNLHRLFAFLRDKPFHERKDILLHHLSVFVQVHIVR